MSTDADTITDELVAGIADRMVEEGRKVSPVTIWPEIPGGSIVAIAAALQRWREARQPLTPHVQVQAGLPEHIAETMMSAADRLWMAAQGEADRAVSQHLSAVNQHLDAARAERDEVLVEYQKTTEEVATGRERHIALTNALSASEEASARLAAELATAAGRAEAAEARADELAQRVSMEEAALAHTKAELDEERHARGELAAAVSSHNDQIAQMTQALDEARQEVISLGYDCQAKSAEADRAVQEASAASSRAEAATAQANESLARVAGLEAERDEARFALEAERQTSAARSEEALIQFDELQRVGRELEAAREQISAMTEAKAAEAERWSQESSAATSRAEAATAQANESLARVATLEAERDEAHATLAAERQTSAARSEAASHQLNELQRVGQELEEARAQINAMTAANTAAIIELAEVSQNASAVSTELAQVAQQASAAKERAEAAEQHAATLQQRLAEVEQAKSAEAERWSQESSTASSRAETATAQANESLARVTALEAELARVSQDASTVKERAEAAEQHAATLAQRLGEAEKARAEDARRSHQLAIQAGDSVKAEEVAELQRQISAQAKAHEKAFNELRTIAEQWVEHAKDLKDRLASANEKLLFIDSRSTGEVALIRKLSSELERLKPDSELISRDTQQKLIGATMAERLSQKGYRYDPATAVMSKVER